MIRCLVSLFFLVSVLPGCTAMVGAGATVGVAAAQERGIKGRVKDLKIEALILEKFAKDGIKLLTTIGVEVYEGRVLLTGATNKTKVSDRAIKIAWSIKGVKGVINEIQLGQGTGIVNVAQDSWITAQIKSNITFDKEIFSINYTVETVNNVVYLIGIAQNKAEHRRVIRHAENTKFVRKVISHVREKDKQKVKN